jgi:hypothetical protein
MYRNNEIQITRREFLKYSTSAALGVGVAASGLGCLNNTKQEESNGMEKKTERAKLSKEYKNTIGLLPKRPPLATKIIYKRKFATYEEWKIEYIAEGSDTMSEPAGRKIPAYYLSRDGLFSSMFY